MRKITRQDLNKLFGFRSNVPWKMIVASLWYVLCLVVFVLALGSNPPVPAGTYDVFIWRISLIVIVLWMASPAIFLSETKLRNRLPLLKEHIGMKSFLGYSIIFLLFTYLFAMVLSWHSPEYKVAFNQYYAQFGF